MRDINFFSPYIETRKTSKTNMVYIVSIVFGLVFVLSGISFTLSYIESKITRDIENIEKFIYSNSTIEQIEEIDDYNKKIQILSAYYDAISKVDSDISKLDVVNTELFKSISSSIPADISFQVLSVSDKTVQIQAIAASKVSIAEFEYNLKKLGMLEDVHVINILSNNTESNNKYVFNLKCKIKDVEKDEA